MELGLWQRLRRRLAARPAAGRGAVGRRAEREAERALAAKGYRALARNWRAGRDEIDLVCLDGETLVFVETRARAAGALVSGYHTLDERKRKALRRVCRAYLRQARPRPRSQRFDVVEIEHERGRIVALRHFENVPLFDKPVNRGAP